MLQAVAGVLLLVAIALAGYRRTFTRIPLPSGARLLFLSGTEFILVGIALGAEFIGILDAETLRGLTPLYTLGLGFAGLIFGLQLDLRRIALFPARYQFAAFLQAVVTMVAVFVPCFLLLRRAYGGGAEVLLSSLVLSASAGCTGPTALALLARELSPPSSRLLEFLRYVSGLDAFFGLVVLGCAFALARAGSAPAVPLAAALLWFGASLAIGACVGALLQLLGRLRCRQEELAVFVLGAVLFAGGAAQHLGLSPLFVCMVSGATLANLRGAGVRVFLLLVPLEKQAYIVLLILAGALWHAGPSWVLAFAALYVVLRLLGKLLGGFLAARAAGRGVRAPASLGLGLVSQGGIAVAMIINFARVAPPALGGA
ncbi:MAG: cation:proton antiporter, partial [Planctomycetes bacterium]|nr:cation:proton antiporter [Planctomycetota bacterium]